MPEEQGSEIRQEESDLVARQPDGTPIVVRIPNPNPRKDRISDDLMTHSVRSPHPDLTEDVPIRLRPQAEIYMSEKVLFRLPVLNPDTRGVTNYNFVLAQPNNPRIREEYQQPSLFLKPIPTTDLDQYSQMQVESLAPFLSDANLEKLNPYLPPTVAEEARKSFGPQGTPAERMGRILAAQPKK